MLLRYKRARLRLTAALASLATAVFLPHAMAETPERACARDWQSGPSGPLITDQFPLAVWIQEPRFADAYKALGINLYVGLWKGPTTEQLETLRQAGMPVIADANEVGRDPANADVMAGWLLPDEPDNAQRRAAGVGYGPPITPGEVQEIYCKDAAIDPARPVFLQLGMGVAWEQWKGRGVRYGRMEDYPEYVKGADIVSFDIYPVTSRVPGVPGRIDLIGIGMDRLTSWVAPDQPAWATVGLTRIHNPDVLPTPAQIQAQIWTAIVHGARGLVYFVHQFKPTFNSAAILADPAGKAALKVENARIQSLAPVLMKGTDVSDLASTDADVELRGIAHGGKRYVLAVSKAKEDISATIVFRDAPAQASEIFTARAVTLKDGAAVVRFPPFAPRIFVYDD